MTLIAVFQSVSEALVKVAAVSVLADLLVLIVQVSCTSKASYRAPMTLVQIILK